MYAAVGHWFFFEKYALPRAEQQDDNEDSKSEFKHYNSRTKIGSRSDVICALYGSVNPYTEWRYWWKDSIIWQTIALADKSGLRKKNTILPDPRIDTKKHEKLDDNALSGFLKNFGIGTEIQETEEQKVERIRTEIASKK